LTFLFNVDKKNYESGCELTGGGLLTPIQPPAKISTPVRFASCAVSEILQVFSRSYCYTVPYDRLLASSWRPSVRPSFCLSLCDAVQLWLSCYCTGLKVVPACS